MAWILGYWIAGMKAAAVLAAFPVAMFGILVAISYFFGMADQNRTLHQLTHVMLRIVRGKRPALPLVFFILAVVLSTLGAGNIGAVALLAPVAMAVASQAALGAFFMTVMLIFGANAGTFSPFSFTGIIANNLVAQLGLSMDPWTEIYFPCFLIFMFMALVQYLVFYLILRKRISNDPAHFTENITAPAPSWNQKQILTLFAIASLIIGVVVFKINAGVLAIVLAVLLILLGAGDGRKVMRTIPWGVVMMVCGVSTLVSIVEQTGGLDILVTGLSKIANPQNITAVLAFAVGIVSSFSSSSAVVMPTFIPLVPALIERMGGGDPAALVLSINVGSHVVDVSPLSTLGALCLANAAGNENKTRLFYRLFIYGLSMSLVGAVTSYLFFG